MWIFPVGDSGKITKHHKKADAPPLAIQVGNPPPLLELINRHSLTIFLLVWVPSILHQIIYVVNLHDLIFFKANVLTGLINLTISTMYTSDVWALIILVLYSVTLCGVPHFVTAFWRTSLTR